MKRMLSAPDVYLYRDNIDFRKSINGLAAIIESDTDLPLGSQLCYMWLYCSGADAPEAALPNVENIALHDYQNSRIRDALLPSWEITVVI